MFLIQNEAGQMNGENIMQGMMGKELKTLLEEMKDLVYNQKQQQHHQQQQHVNTAPIQLRR